ncbi:hypothetical protein OG216_33285 [Streptomycetaceae bacterium NBC_01309]
MVRVVIAPSYGSAESRRHWHDTLDSPLRFQTPERLRCLADSQLADLLALHPDGQARFWGARPAHDTKMAEVKLGDIVLFTGAGCVRAVGEVGAIFRNSAFADVLWPPSPDGESWHTVYSLRGFEKVEIPYAYLCRLLGYNERHTFPGQIVLTGTKAQEVVDWLLVDTATDSEAAAAQAVGEAAGLDVERQLTLLMPESVHATATQYEQPAAFRVANRTEAILLQDYREQLSNTEHRRYRCAAGITDLYLETAESIEVVEAKRDSAFVLVRQAVGQLLAYAPYCPSPGCLRLTGLFPKPVDVVGLDLLHRYGIDCVFMEAPGVYTRLPAPEERLAVMREIWAAS